MTSQSNQKMRRAVAGAGAIILLAALAHRTTFFAAFEQTTLDFRYRAFNRKQPASERVVFLDIDEQSLKILEPYFGRWPWPRRVYKETLEFLEIGKPSGVFFDLLFSERMLQGNDDKHLAQVTEELGNISHAMMLLEAPAQSRTQAPDLPHSVKSRAALHWKEMPPPYAFGEKTYSDFLLPLPQHVELLPHFHTVNFDKDSDGVFRHAPLVMRYGDTYLPSMGLAGLLSTMKGPEVEYRRDRLILSDRLGASLSVPIDENGQLPLHFYAPDLSPRSIPFSIVVQSALQLQRGQVTDPDDLEINPYTLKDKVILIGASAAGLEDLKATPIHSSYPGALLQATAISNVLSQDFLHEPPKSIRFVVSLLMLVSIYFCLFYFESFAVRLILPLLIILAQQVLAVVLFKYQSHWMNMAVPFFMGTAAWLDGLAYIAFVESAEKRRMKSTLTKYLSPYVTERLIASGKNPEAEVGRLEEVTILFSDIRGFTTLSENYNPELVVDCLNKYLGKMSDVLFEHSGTLDKFIGDSILAFWGAPLKDDLHAVHALACAFEMRDRLRNLNAEWKSGLPSRPEFKIGIGINTGKVIVGNIGSEKHLNYTVVGDTVNIASRLEGLTKEYGAWTVIGPRTYELVKNSIVCRLLDEVQVKGRLQCVKIYEPLIENDKQRAESTRAFALEFEEAIREFLEGNYTRALTRFSKLDGAVPGGDGPSQVYLNRIRSLQSGAGEIKHVSSK